MSIKDSLNSAIKSSLIIEEGPYHSPMRKWMDNKLDDAGDVIKKGANAAGAAVSSAADKAQQAATRRFGQSDNIASDSPLRKIIGQKVNITPEMHAANVMDNAKHASQHDAISSGTINAAADRAKAVKATAEAEASSKLLAQQSADATDAAKSASQHAAIPSAAKASDAELTLDKVKNFANKGIDAMDDIHPAAKWAASGGIAAGLGALALRKRLGKLKK